MRRSGGRLQIANAIPTYYLYAMANLSLHLLAGMAHELRTPLGAIGGYAELLELGVHGPVTPAQADGLGRIRRNQQLMVSLLSAFMAYAEAAEGDLPLALESIDLDDALARTRLGLSARAIERSVAIDLPLAGARRVRADVEALSALLHELLLDAVESALPGTAVRVTFHGGHGKWSVTVESSGEGIVTEATDAVFDPFSRVARSNRPSASRHALSLPHARVLARAMSGEITARPDALDRVVTLDLPAA